MRGTKVLFRAAFGAFLALSTLNAAATGTAELDAAQIKFEQAMALRESGEPFAAIGLFRELVHEHPTLRRARMELALTLFRNLLYEEARREATYVLEQPDTPEGVKVTLRELIARTDLQSEPHSLNASVWLGPMYDSNPNIGPQSSELRDLGVLLGTPIDPREDVALSFLGRVSHRYLFSETADLGEASGAIAWLSDAQWFRNDYREQNESDLDILSLRTGPVLLIGRQARLSAAVRWQRLLLGHDRFADFLGVQAGLSFAAVGGDIALTAEYQDRDYAQTNNARDSDYISVRGSVERGLSDSVLLKVDSEVFTENANEARFSNDGVGVSVGLFWQAWPDGTLSMELNRRWTEHRGTEPGLAILGGGQTRDEVFSRYTLSATFDLDTLLEPVEGIALNLYVTRSENRSNVASFDFRRTQVGLSLGKTF